VKTLRAAARDRGEEFECAALRRDAGIGLPDTVINMVIVPILVIALATTLFVAVRTVAYVMSSSAQTTAAQVIAGDLQVDTTAAQLVTASSTGQQCGPGTQILGLAWGGGAGGLSAASVVSYSIVGNGSNFSLWRYYCATGPAVVPTTQALLTGYAANAGEVASLLPSSTSQTTWVSTSSVSEVELRFNTPDHTWPVTLVATPADSLGG